MNLFGYCCSSANPDQLDFLHKKASKDIGGAENAIKAAGIGAFSLGAETSSVNMQNHVLLVKGQPLLSDQRASPVNLLEEYLQCGTELFRKLKGPFALAIIDSQKAKIILAVDRFAREKLAYRCIDGGLIFADDIEWCASATIGRPRLRNQGVYDYLFFHMLPSPNSIYDGILKLPPAHYVTWESNKLQNTCYWKPQFQESRYSNFSDLEEELHQLLHQAVQRCEPDAQSGAFLSGGLDSSTVAGYLSKVQQGKAKSFSMGFGVEGYDELTYARIAVERFKLEGHEYRVTPADIVSAFPSIAEHYDEPFGNSSVIPTLCCAKFAKANGVCHLLAGDGGDELFAGNERYARQKVFEAYHHIPNVVRRSILEPLARQFSEESFLPFRKLHSYIGQATIPLPERLETWNYAYREDVSAMLSDEFADSVDIEEPMRQMNTVYSSVEQDVSTLNRLLYYDWRFTLADSDLRKVGAMCDLAGVKVSYPMLDDDLVEFSIRIPSRVKMPGLKLRAFYKTAMQGFLPDQILNKSKHGFGLPFGVWLKSDKQLRDLISSNLSDLNKRQIFNVEFLNGLLDEHATGHASYYGYFIWDLAILEEWLKQRNL